MKLYRISQRHPDHEHVGYYFLTSKKEAETEQRKCDKEFNDQTGLKTKNEVDEIEFTLTKKGVLDLLNAWATYPNNG